MIEPLTLPLWPAFEDLLEQGGPAERCWCMAPRIGAEYRRRAPEQNRADFRQVVAHGPPPGLVAAVEAYPLDGSMSPSATATGYASTFAAAGFVEVARRAPHLPMMRYSFSELHPQRRGRAG